MCCLVFHSKYDNAAYSNEMFHFLAPITAINIHAHIVLNVFSLHLLISTIISLVGIIMAIDWENEKRCEAYFIMLYLRGVFWVITFVSVLYK